jgi:O-antigen/teichoic acid export membrane protein
MIISYAGFTLPDFSVLRSYIIYSLPLIPSNTFSQIVSSSDRLVIGYYLGAGSVGIYSAAYSMASILLMFNSLITFILHPTVFNLYDRGRIEQVRIYLSNSWKYIMMLSIPMAVGLYILAEPLLGVMTTAEFISEGKLVIPIVALSAVIENAYSMFTTVLLLSRRTIIFAIAIGIAAALNLGLNILLVPYWGIIAAAITTLISYLVVAIIFYYQGRKYLIFDMNTRFVVKSIFSSSLMAAVIWVIKPAGVLEIILSIILGIIIYFSVLFLLRGFNRTELKFILDLVKGITRQLRITN